jgi:hypothetical protein
VGVLYEDFVTEVPVIESLVGLAERSAELECLVGDRSAGAVSPLLFFYARC